MSRDIKTKFKAGDIPTTGLQLDWTIRDADLARDAADDPTRPLYWPPRPPMPPGQQYCAATEYAVLQALRSHAGEPVDGKFTCRPKVATIARITGLDPSTVRRYLKCLRERGVIKWRPWGKARLFELNIKRLAAAAGKATADYANAETKRSEAEQSEEERLDKLWDADVLNASVVKAAPAASATDQAILNAIGDGPTMVDTASEDYDLLAEGKRLDAEVEAQNNAEDLVKPPAGSTTKAVKAKANWQRGVRSVYADLGRTDIPTDLQSAATMFEALVERVDRVYKAESTNTNAFSLMYEFALAHDWWLPQLKKYKGCPISYLDRNFGTIAEQYQEKQAKIRAKSTQKTTSKLTISAPKNAPWDPKRWQREFDDAQAEKDAAQERIDADAFYRAGERMEELEAERNAATGAPVELKVDDSSEDDNISFEDDESGDSSNNDFEGFDIPDLPEASWPE